MKTFSLEQANALIPQLEELLDEMARVRDRLLGIGPSLETVLRAADGNGGSKQASAYVSIVKTSCAFKQSGHRVHINSQM